MSPLMGEERAHRDAVNLPRTAQPVSDGARIQLQTLTPERVSLTSMFHSLLLSENSTFHSVERSGTNSTDSYDMHSEVCLVSSFKAKICLNHF